MADTAYRQEYPRPQFRRNTWINLNGEWDFTIDQALTGEERDFQNAKQFDRKIQVPFCPGKPAFGYCAHRFHARRLVHTHIYPSGGMAAGRAAQLCPHRRLRLSDKGVYQRTAGRAAHRRLQQLLL